MPKKPTRKVSVSRAASLKGWRTRRAMKEARISEVGLATYRGDIALTRERAGEYLTNYEAAARRSLHQVSGRTIDLVPKVEWPK